MATRHNLNHFGDKARYWLKTAIFSYPFHCIRRPRYRGSPSEYIALYGIALYLMFGMEKLECCGYLVVWIFLDFGALHSHKTPLATGLAMHIARTMLSQNICLSHAGIVPKRLNVSSKFFIVPTLWQYSDGDTLRVASSAGDMKNPDF